MSITILVTEDSLGSESIDTTSGFTLADLTYRVARELGIVREGSATGGSITTIADTVNRTEADDYWNKGTAWILHDAGGGGASPQGKSRVITDFANTGGVITLQSTVTDAVVSGDYYAVAKKNVPQSILIQKVNTALQEMGPVPIFNSTKITTADDQTEYDLPVAATRDLRQVLLQTDKNDSDDNRWEEVFNWSVQLTSTGTASKLILPKQYSAGYKIGLVYTDYHPALYADTDKLSETVPVQRAVWPAVLACFEYLKQTKHVSDYDGDIVKWTEKVASLNQLHSIVIPRKPGRICIIDNTTTIREDEPNKVYLNNG